MRRSTCLLRPVSCNLLPVSQPPLRLLHLTPPLTPAYGGPYESIRNLTGGLAGAGAEVLVRMPHSAEALAYQDQWRAPMRSEGAVRVSPLGFSPQLRRLVLADDADVLHTHGLWQHASWLALTWKQQTGRPHVASIRGMLEPWAWQHHAWKKRPVWTLWERRNLQTASLLHATSEMEVESIRARGLTAPVAVLPNGVHLPELPLDSVMAELRRPRTALYLGRVHPKKGLPLLLQAWARVQPADWRLRIVGPDEGGHRAELEQQAAALGLGERVRFDGPLTGAAKAEAFRSSELFILPTHSENFGIAVAEALAYGLPVITTQGTPWQGLESHACGWWVKVSVEGIAEALEVACASPPEQLAQMGQRGRQWMAEDFSWDAIASEFLKCYRWVCGDGEKPGVVVG